MFIKVDAYSAKYAKALADIYNYYVVNTTATFEEKPIKPRDFAKRLKLISARYPVLVLVYDDEPVGYAYLNEFNPRSAYRHTADLSIYIDRSYTSSGFGEKLLDKLIRIAKERGIKRIVSVITEDNEASLCFHEKQGFRNCGTLEGVGEKFGKTFGVSYYLKTI